MFIFIRILLISFLSFAHLQAMQNFKPIEKTTQTLLTFTPFYNFKICFKDNLCINYNLKYPTHIGGHFLVSPIKQSSLLLLQNLYNEKDKHSLIWVPLLMEDKSYKTQESLSFLKNKRDLEEVIIGLHNQLPILEHDIIFNFSEKKIIQTIKFKNSDIYDNPVQLDNPVNMQAVLQRIQNNEAKSFILYPKESILRKPNAMRIISIVEREKFWSDLKEIKDIDINGNKNA